MIDKNLVEIICQIIKAIKSDYPVTCVKIFANDEDEKTYKNSLYKKLKGSSKDDIFEAYDLWVEKNETKPPKVIDLIQILIGIEKTLSAKHEEVVGHVSESIQSPLQMFRDAIEAAGDKTDHEAWLKRKAEALEKHKALLKKHDSKISKGSFAKSWETEKIIDHSCSVAFCNEPGTVSGAFGEGINYYCQKHFVNYG